MVLSMNFMRSECILQDYLVGTSQITLILTRLTMFTFSSWVQKGASQHPPGAGNHVYIFKIILLISSTSVLKEGVKTFLTLEKFRHCSPTRRI